MLQKIIYNFASKSRPDKFFNCLDNIREMSERGDYFVVAKIDEDDKSMINDYVLSKIKEIYPEVVIKIGISTSKINAINRSLFDIPAFDIMCTHSDDMWFIKKGFDNDILKAFEGWNGLVHFPDQKSKETLVTYPMMTKAYYERFWYIYHPSYDSVYADNEQTEVAKRLGLYKFVDQQILEHRHHLWGYGEKDALSMLTDSPLVYAKDHATFSRRKAINFEL